MKKTFTIILIILTISWVLFLIGGIFYNHYSEPNWTKINNTTIGTVYKISLGKGGGAWFRYTVDNKEYKIFEGLNEYGLTVGEKYVLKYLKEDPNKIQAINDRPVFVEGEDYFTDTAIITRVYKFKLWSDEADHGVQFKYNVNGKTFERSQTLPLDYSRLYPDLQEGKKYLVIVWRADFNRAIIYLNRPVN